VFVEVLEEDHGLAVGGVGEEGLGGFWDGVREVCKEGGVCMKAYTYSCIAVYLLN